jgi:hypothetical protein
MYRRYAVSITLEQHDLNSSQSKSHLHRQIDRRIGHAVFHVVREQNLNGLRPQLRFGTLNILR